MTTYDELAAGDYIDDKSLSDFMGEWCEWLHSPFAEFSAGPFETFFTRGAVEYIDGPLGRVQAGTHYNRDENKPGGIPVLPVRPDTPIYVDMMPSYYFVNELDYQGRQLNSINDCKQVCRLETSISETLPVTIPDGGGVKPGPFGRIKKEGDAAFTDLTPIRIEKEVHIDVPASAQLAPNFRYPVVRGTHIDGYVVGFIALIKKLPDAHKSYHLEFGGAGIGPFLSVSSYKLRVP